MNSPRFLLRICLVTLCCMVSEMAAKAAVFNTGDAQVVVKDFGYQLQGPTSAGGQLTPGPLAVGAHDLVVMDFARYGDEGSKFTPAEITSIKHSDPALGGDGHRKVTAAYMSIGEASEFRTFWDDSWTQNGSANSTLSATAPNWLGPVNPFFTESRKVRYWESGWQDIVFNDANNGWLDQIVTQGFDSAYLDIVDAFYFWGHEVQPADHAVGDPSDGSEAARRMIDFVVDMTEHARLTNPDFFVIPQNGEFILSDLMYDGVSDPGDPARRDAYLDAIGAIGIEDTYFRGGSDENNNFNPDVSKINVLKNDFLANGIPVLVTDYVNDTAKVSQFQAEARADGFIPFAAYSRDLNNLDPVAPDVTLADFNADGDVDGADFLNWQRGYDEASSSAASGNADFDSDVDGNDLTIWQSEYGVNSAPAIVSVPEPSTIYSVLWGIVVMLINQNYRGGKVELAVSRITVVSSSRVAR